MITHDTFFPNEAFDPEREEEDIPESDMVASGLERHWRFVKELQMIRQKILEVEKGHLDAKGNISKEREAEFARLIHEGHIARENIDSAGSDYDGSLDDIIRASDDARMTLVLANLPFAARLARYSMGKAYVEEPKAFDAVYSDDDIVTRKSVGAFYPIANLAHSRGSLEDRTQVAMQAMWEAAEKFEVRDTGHGQARFISYAAWVVQHQLVLHTSTEVGGWDISDHILQLYSNAIKKQKINGGERPVIRHNSGYESSHVGYHPAVVFEGRKGVPLDEVDAFHAPEEATVFDESGQLSIEDVVSDEFTKGNERVIGRNELLRAIKSALPYLSEREARVITMIYGLDDGKMMSRREVGESYSLTRQRIDQIERKALNIIRERVSQELRVYLDDPEPTTPEISLPTLVQGAAHIKTRPVKLSNETK